MYFLKRSASAEHTGKSCIDPHVVDHGSIFFEINRINASYTPVSLEQKVLYVILTFVESVTFISVSVLDLSPVARV